MRVEIDQSGKIEATNKPTVVCFSNSESKSILIKRRGKRQLQEIFRKAGKPRMFVIQTFSCLIYLLLKDFLPKISQIVIDREYPGYENLIKSYLVQLAKSDSKTLFSDMIHFTEIGRKSRAHLKAYQDYRKKKANWEAEAEDILGLVLRLK